MKNPTEINFASLPWLPLDAKTAFPKNPAIYFAIDSTDTIQYIGRSVNPRARWQNHHRYESIGNIRIAYLFVDLPDLLAEIETALIEWFDPPLNVVGKVSNLRESSASSNIKIKLKEVRESKNISQYQLAQLSGMSPQNIQKLEQGRSKGIQFDTLDKLCNVLECDIQELLVRIEKS